MAKGGYGRLGGRVCVAIAAALAASGWSAEARAFGVKKTPGGLPVHWEAPGVTFHVDDSVTSAAPGADDGISAAAGAWSGLDGAPTLTIARGGGGSKPGNDGLNTIFFADEGSSLAGGALAVTVFTFDDTGRAIDADIVLNGRHPFGVLAAGAEPPKGASPMSNEGGGESDSDSDHATPFDLVHVTAHELGHALGLADQTDDHAALMYLYTSPGDASVRAPAADDQAGIASLYVGTAPDAAASAGGCGKSSVSPRAPSHAASRVALAFALGLVAWALLRHRRGAAPAILGALGLAALLALPGERTARSEVPVGARSSRGDAHAQVTRVETAIDAAGIFTTRAALATTVCRAMRCPSASVATAFGGSLGGIHQIVGGEAAPRTGDEVEVSFDGDAFSPLTARGFLGAEAARGAHLVRR